MYAFISCINLPKNMKTIYEFQCVYMRYEFYMVRTELIN